MKRIIKSHATPARRGSTYIMVLGTAMLITIIGLSAMLAVRVQGKSQDNRSTTAMARALAQSAVDFALHKLDGDAAWRSTYQHGVESSAVNLGRGTFSFRLEDADDGNLADDPSQPVWIVGIGKVGTARQRVRVQAAASPGAPLEILSMGIHSGGRLRIEGSRTLSVIGAPASSNDEFKNDGTLNGSVEAVSQNGSGAVTGTKTIPSPAKQMPADSVIDDYIAEATELPFVGDLYNIVLTPGVNEYGGGLNANGVYYINTSDYEVMIQGCRLHGTLVIDAGNSTVYVDSRVLMQNYRGDRPVLIVRGNLELYYQSFDTAGNDVTFAESVWNHNFNPPGAPYQSVTDSDKTDLYPSEIQGLVHVTGQFLIYSRSRVRGAVIVGDEARMASDSQIVHDPALITNPPQGYGERGSLRLVPGTWSRVVE